MKNSLIKSDCLANFPFIHGKVTFCCKLQTCPSKCIRLKSSTKKDCIASVMCHCYIIIFNSLQSMQKVLYFFMLETSATPNKINELNDTKL